MSKEMTRLLPHQLLDDLSQVIIARSIYVTISTVKTVINKE